MEKKSKAKKNALKRIDMDNGEYWVIEGPPEPVSPEEWQEIVGQLRIPSAEEGWRGVGLGDKVRVRSTAVTEAKGLAGLVGMVCGQTTPSVTQGLIGEIVGEPKQDYAVNVLFEGRETTWFAPDLLELVESPPR